MMEARILVAKEYSLNIISCPRNIAEPSRSLKTRYYSFREEMPKQCNG
jgi:hypothetical protein